MNGDGDQNVLQIPSQMRIPKPPSGYTPLPMFGGQLGAGGGFQPRQELIDSIIKRESSGKTGARGKAGELGLMQIMPATAAQYGINPEQLSDPTINRQVGTRYFGDLLKRYKGNEMMALMAYNSGPHNVDKGRFVPSAAKYATDVLANSRNPMQQIQAQPPPMSMPPPQTLQQVEAQPGAGEQQPPPSMLSRIGGALASGLEGTAYAQEPPPPPPTGYTRMGGPMAAAAPAPQPPPAGGQAGPPQMFGQQMKPSMTVDSSGKLRIGMTPATTPAQIQQQQLSADVALTQINDAIGFYDSKIRPRESEFTGPIWTQSGRKGMAQPFEAQHSRWAQALGMNQADPSVKSFYDRIGPAIGSQMRALIGGRLGYYIVNQSSLTPHLPNIDNDSLPRMREKLEDLKHTIPLVVNQINKFRAQGMSDDQIIQQMGGNPTDAEPPPPGFEE